MGYEIVHETSKYGFLTDEEFDIVAVHPMMRGHWVGLCTFSWVQQSMRLYKMVRDETREYLSKYN